MKIFQFFRKGSSPATQPHEQPAPPQPDAVSCAMPDAASGTGSTDAAPEGAGQISPQNCPTDCPAPSPGPVSRPEASPEADPSGPADASPPTATPLLSGGAYLLRCFKALGLMVGLGLCCVLPYTCWWLHASGDLAVERAVAAQQTGQFALFCFSYYSASPVSPSEGSSVVSAAVSSPSVMPVICSKYLKVVHSAKSGRCTAER